MGNTKSNNNIQDSNINEKCHHYKCKESSLPNMTCCNKHRCVEGGCLYVKRHNQDLCDYHCSRALIL